MKNTMGALRVLEWIRKQRHVCRDKTAVWAADICRAVAVKKGLGIEVIRNIDAFIEKHQGETYQTSDWAFRVCQAHIARAAGFTDRAQWTELLLKEFRH